MNGKLSIVSLVATLFVVSATWGQVPGPSGATKEHQWLKQFVGQWQSRSKAVSPDPDQPAVECTGTMNSRMLGEYWLVSNLEGEMSGVRINAIQTIGYDEKSKAYVGTWVDNMMSHMWTYKGSVDADGKRLTLEAEGPNFMAEGKMAKFRDVYEFKSPDHIVATSLMKSDDGTWVTFMTGEFRRKTP